MVTAYKPYDEFLFFWISDSIVLTNEKFGKVKEDRGKVALMKLSLNFLNI